MGPELRERVFLACEPWVERGGRRWLVVWRDRAWLSRFPWGFLLLGAHAVELPADEQVRPEDLRGLEGGIHEWRRSYLTDGVVPHLEEVLAGEDERARVD